MMNKIKKLYELTDDELFACIYKESEKYKLKEYKDRPRNNSNGPCTNISYDNCQYCNFNSIECHINCSIHCIDFDAIRKGIYKDDEVEIEVETYE